MRCQGFHSHSGAKSHGLTNSPRLAPQESYWDDLMALIPRGLRISPSVFWIFSSYSEPKRLESRFGHARKISKKSNASSYTSIFRPGSTCARCAMADGIDFTDNLCPTHCKSLEDLSREETHLRKSIEQTCLVCSKAQHKSSVLMYIIGFFKISLFTRCLGVFSSTHKRLPPGLKNRHWLWLWIYEISRGSQILAVLDQGIPFRRPSLRTDRRSHPVCSTLTRKPRPKERFWGETGLLPGHRQNKMLHWILWVLLAIKCISKYPLLLPPTRPRAC